MKIVKKFLALFRCKWGGKYEKKEKDKDILLLLVIVHLWVLIILGLLAQEHLRNLEENEFGRVEYGNSVVTNKVLAKKKLKDKCSVARGYDCTVTCTGLNFHKQDDVDALYVSLEDAKKEHECKLKLDSATFYQYKLQENWITPDPAKHVNITKLEIAGGQLNDITYNSFACLPYLTTLTIYNTEFTSLTKTSFINMPELRTLELRNNQNLNHAEMGFLQNFELTTLQIQQLYLTQDSTVEFLANLTGGEKYPSLSSIDWSFNNIGYFPKKLVSDYSSRLILLTLSASNITEFENGTFGAIPGNGKIVMDRNKLKRFPEDEYRSVVENVGVIFVKDNKLICDCEMEWLQIFVKQEKNGDYGDFNFTKCDVPEDVPFLEADMCPETTSTTSETTDATTASPSDEPCTGNSEGTSETPTIIPTSLPPTEPTHSSSEAPPATSGLPDIPINCEPYENKRSRRSISLSPFRITTRDEITIHLPQPTEYLEIEEDDEGEVSIKFGNKTRRSLLYWEESEYRQINESDIECYTDITVAKVNIPVEPDANYVFCLINASDSRINILNCRGFKSKPAFLNQTWLPNKMRATAITAVAASAAVLIIIGASLFYLIVRKNPTLIRGSERVIVVKRHNKAQFMVLPRGHSDSTITGSSKYALTDSTMDPSISGDSLSTVSYISAIQPTPLEIFRYRLERLQMLTWRNQNEEDDDGDRTPPPLPPYPIQICQPRCHARLPPNVDLLFEYEWYTTTTTTTTS